MPNLLTMRIEGHLGRDPEYVNREGSKPYWRFSVAVNIGSKEHERVQWVTVYDRSKYPQSQYLHKGDAVTCEGEPWARGWQKKESNEIMADLCLTTFKVLQIDWHKGEMKTETENPVTIISDMARDPDLPF